jgi:hypothetical protein
MGDVGSLNVFHGPDSVAQYFNPDLQPPLSLVELPARLNSFRRENFRIYAKMLAALPVQNVKAIPGKVIPDFWFWWNPAKTLV